MEPERKIAMVAGSFFIVAFVASVPGPFALYTSILHDPRFIVTGTGDAGVALGAFLEVILAISVIGTAVTLFPVIKKQNEGIALGYVCGRLVEAVIIVVGIIGLLSIVTLQQDFARAAGANADSYVSVGKSLVAVHDWTFLIGPNLALGPNTLMLAYLMYKSQLVPRFIAILGLVGGPLLFAFATAVLFGVFEQVSVWGALGALPVFAWEMSLAVWLIVKGFKPSPLDHHNEMIGRK
jgi:Ca2+/Na+ antiporter